MQQPKNVSEALLQLHRLSMAIANDLGNYLDNPQDYTPEYFEGVMEAALDTHLLVTWVRDRIE